MNDEFVKADSRNLPKLDNGALMEYFASNSNHNLAEIRGAKILMSSRDSYLDTAVGHVQVCRKGSECQVKARVVPEHRVNNKPYTVICKINETDDVVLDSTCQDCAAAAGGCKHALLLLFWLVKKSSEPASTSAECYWKKPTLSTARAEHVSSKDIFPKAKKPKLAPKDPSILAAFYEECQKRNIKNSLIIKYNTEMPRDQNMNMFDLILTFVEKKVTHDFTNFKTFLHETIDGNVIKSINEKTVGQNDCKFWHNIRQARLTASKLHEAANCQTDGSLVQQILGGYKVPETKQIQRGRKLEAEVLKVVEEKLCTNIKKSGFVLINGLLGASPDGVAEAFVVEVKCPTTTKAVSTYIKDGKIQNKFKTQIQCQMLACGKKKALFCVADPCFEVTRNVNLVWETFDACYINNFIKRAEQFWETYIFTKLIKSALN